MTTNTKQTVLEHFNRLNSGDTAGAASLMSEDCVNHSAIPEAQGRAGFERIVGKIRTAFPDMSYTLDDVIVEGDKAVMRMTMSGTNRGPMTFTRMPAEPTGKAVKFEQIHIMRVLDGKIVEHWLGQDSLAMFRQLGFQVTPAS
ncbi:MAG: ester cyclase [Polyangiales bacterium]